MEQKKIFLNERNYFRFDTRKWNAINDNSKSNYDATNEITYNTEISSYNNA